MANPNPTKMSPAELRRRLMSPPSSPTIEIPEPEESEAPSPPSRFAPRRSDASRFGGSGCTQSTIDLDSLVQDISHGSSAKLTPLPESRLDPSQFRSVDSGIPFAQPMQPAASSSSNELENLRMQNAELTRIMEEMKPLLEEASAQELRGQSKDQEVEKLLEERDYKIMELQDQIQKLEEQIASVPPPKAPKTRDELEEWADELEQDSSKLNQERRTLDQERKQLRDDEEALEKQMREMECSMARERAMMARQETELRRLSAEIQHELELLQRGDGTLREQLSKFQRRHQEVLSRTSGGGPPAPVAAAAPEPPAPVARKENSGLFGRMFRK